MKKWLDKYDAPKAQNGIEGTMGGLTDKGFNYNGAWGGPSMQMGGNIQPPMAGADQTLPMYQMGGYVYPTTFVPQAQTGTRLSPVEEIQYNTWRVGLPKNLQSEGDYDLRGLWKENPNVKPSANLHFTDTYKLPNHPTFSDESKYFNPKTKKYAGHWNETDSSWNYMPYDTTIKKMIVEKKLAMGGSVPGSVGFTYARTKGIPSEGPYGKKTVPSAQKGKKIDIRRVPKRTDSDAENLFEILDPTGLSSWDDIIRSYKDPNAAWWETGLEVLGAIPFLGNIAKVTKPGIHLAKYSNVDKALFNTLPKNKSLSRTVSGASKGGRGTDTYQAYDEYQNGGEMQFYQNGLDWTPRNISRNGSVVKDDNGYWNPDNWGKVVEIDSPNITMKGVNQDLIGVSDEGDVRYMEPGKDYKFKGKKVKEYPVGKYGVNQQDEKTVQHLDQLLNFTNKPKAKNGWLDKYK